jgi:hypothetical protein
VHRARVLDAHYWYGRQIRFEGHAALRAGTGAFLTDVEIHRAGVLDCWTGRGLCLVPRGVEKPRGIGSELLEAAAAAEVVRLALVFDVGDRVVRRDRHSTDGVEHFGGRDGRMIVRMG